MQLFNLDSPLMRFLNMMADVIIISLLWLVASLPIVTIGASTSAAYFVITRRISNREGYVFKDFIKGFKVNFVTATLVFLTLVAILLLGWLNIMNSQYYGAFQIAAVPLNILIILESLFVYVHIFPLASRFDMKYKQLMKSAFLLANKHLLTTIAHVLLLAAVLALCYLYPVFLMFAFGAYCWLSSYLLIRIYRKYRPEMDKDEVLQE